MLVSSSLWHSLEWSLDLLCSGENMWISAMPTKDWAISDFPMVEMLLLYELWSELNLWEWQLVHWCPIHKCISLLRGFLFNHSCTSPDSASQGEQIDHHVFSMLLWCPWHRCQSRFCHLLEYQEVSLEREKNAVLPAEVCNGPAGIMVW